MNLISIFKKKNKKTLFTTPSHNGNLCIYHKFYQWYKKDISEVDAYNPQKALAEAELKAANIYETKYTKFLTNGSTSGIIAAIIASKVKNILIWDKAHPCHRNGAELAGLNIIEYALPFDDSLGLYKAISNSQVSDLLKKHASGDTALLITSPTYEGFVVDVKNISKICHQNNVKLIVDEAHGALYPFSDELPISAVRYADYTIQSLHKTAGGINPTALLHSNDNNPDEALNKINTTSPSYPMLATIEANITFLNSANGKKKLHELINNIKALNIVKLNDDITKILLKHNKYNGYELSEKLFEEYNIEDERTNEKSTMLLCGLGTTKRMLQKLDKALHNLGF